jgi:hypothetical protein
MKSLQWGKGNNTRREARASDSLDKAGRTARAIHQRVKYERSLASTAAREARLRALMGLPAGREPALLDNEGEGRDFKCAP